MSLPGVVYGGLSYITWMTCSVQLSHVDVRKGDGRLVVSRSPRPFVGDAVQQHRVVGVELHHGGRVDEVVDAVGVERDSVVPGVVDVFVPPDIDRRAGLVVGDVPGALAAG